jgi:GT2 family glycosyltransferase
MRTGSRTAPPEAGPQTRDSVAPAEASVDIIVPLYNKRSVLDRALDSILVQTHRDWRVIVVDDGSTDGSLQVLRQRPYDPRLRLLEQRNQGPGAARNRGLREATAPYVAFLDADDEWLPTFLEETLEALRGHPECAVAASSWYLGPSGEDQTPKHRAQGIRTGAWRCPTRGVGFLDLKNSVDYCHSSAVLCRREEIVRLGGFYDRDRCTYGEDSYLWLRLLMQSPVYRVTRPLIWLHTDASELGHGRRTPYPVPPILYHVDEALAECPESHRALLASYLDDYTIWVAGLLARQGEGREARRLLSLRSPEPTMDELHEVLRNTLRTARIWPLVRLRRRLGAIRTSASAIGQRHMHPRAHHRAGLPR